MAALDDLILIRDVTDRRQAVSGSCLRLMHVNLKRSDRPSVEHS